MSLPTFENLLLEIKDNVAVLSFNRPKALNALNGATLRELEKALHFIEEAAPGRGSKNKIDVVIMTGTGEKSFIAGADILEMKEKNTKEGEEFARFGQNLTRAIECLPQAVIAAVNGFALGGGCEFAMAADFILASENAVFGQPEVALGIIPGFGACVRLARTIGLPAARDLIYTGRKIKAEEARRMGLVNDVVPQAELMNRAHAIAQEIRKNSPLAIAKAKQVMNQTWNMSVDEALKIEALVFGSIFGSHDQREGMGAFAEKRKVAFRGE